ncbi:MAG: ThiF family adenylyltransferase, partial [Aliihoeflea sp.]
VVTHPVRLTTQNAGALLAGYDIAVDGSDNFATRYALADACALARVTLVTGAVGRFDGSVTVLKPFETGPDGGRNPSYRDLFPEPPPEGLVPSCAEAGVVGALVGVIGTLQAMEVIKLITGAGEPLIGRLLLYDGLRARFDVVRYKAATP